MQQDIVVQQRAILAAGYRCCVSRTFSCHLLLSISKAAMSRASWDHNNSQSVPRKLATSSPPGGYGLIMNCHANTSSSIPSRRLLYKSFMIKLLYRKPSKSAPDLCLFSWILQYRRLLHVIRCRSACAMSRRLATVPSTGLHNPFITRNCSLTRRLPVEVCRTGGSQEEPSCLESSCKARPSLFMENMHVQQSIDTGVVAEKISRKVQNYGVKTP